jgi:DNA polymerase-3 subunit beta
MACCGIGSSIGATRPVTPLLSQFNANMATAAHETAGSARAGAAFQIATARSTILDALRRAVSAVASRNTLPVLNAALFEAEGTLMASPRQVKITTTDLDRRLESQFGATVTGSGKVCLPAKRLLEIISSFPSAAPVTIDVAGTRARVTAGRSRFEVLGLSHEEFPMNVDFRPKIDRVKIEGKAIVDALSRIAPFTAQDMSRPTLGGVMLEAANDGLFLVSTDGRRMGRIKVSNEASFRAECIIPPEAVPAIKSAFANEEEIILSANENQLRLQGKDTTVTTRLVEGPYPQYRATIPGPPKVTVIVNRELFVDAVKRVSLVSPEKTRSVALQLSQKEIRFATNSPDEGTGRDAVECRYDGDVTAVPKLAVNSAYLTSVVDAIGADENGEIALQLCGAERAIVIRHPKTPTSPTLGIIMPLRLLDHIWDED